MKNILLPLVLGFAALLPGCSSGGSSSQPPTIVSIAVTPGTASVAAGLPQGFTAMGTLSSGATQDVTATATWASSNTAVATIVAGGSATTLTAGTASITATLSSVVGTAALTVTAPVLESIAVTPANSTVPVGTLTQFTATGTYSDKSTQDLTATAAWISSNAATATIASTGLLTALTVNSTPITITATSGGVSGSTGLTVATPTLTSIVLSGAPTVTIANGTSYQFIAYGLYNDGSKHIITTSAAWTSSDTAVATIGAATARALSVGAGSTTITAAYESMTGTATLDVTSATIQSIAVAPSSTTIAPLTTQAFTAIGTFSDASTQNITHDVVWTSSKPAAATISNSSGSVGFATGVASGKTSILATFGGVTGTAPLTVSTATLTSIAVTPTNVGMAVGSTLAMNALGTFSDQTTQPLATVCTWSSSDTGVASLSGNIATGVSAGAVTITCSLNGVSGTANLAVEEFTAITISPPDASFAQNTSVSLTATGTLTDGTMQDLTNSVVWTSSNPSVVTMSDAFGSFGTAIGSAPGSATVTASLTGQIGVSSLTVTNATLTSILVKPVDPVITLGNRKQFSAQGTFSDGTTENLSNQVVWTSSDPAVAIINATGAAVSSGAGMTTITATLGEVNGTTTLTVQPVCTGGGNGCP
jgi:trimeric autotransporter adhesin